MKLGLGVFRHSSADFWSFSLREWQAAVAGYQEENGLGHRPLRVDELKSLMEQFPDDA